MPVRFPFPFHSVNRLTLHVAVANGKEVRLVLERQVTDNYRFLDPSQHSQRERTIFHLTRVFRFVPTLLRKI